MPDLTPESYFVCAPYADWLADPASHGDGVPYPTTLTECPPCRWHQFVDGGQPSADGARCPRCGGETTIIRFAV